MYIIYYDSVLSLFAPFTAAVHSVTGQIKIWFLNEVNWQCYRTGQFHSLTQSKVLQGFVGAHYPALTLFCEIFEVLTFYLKENVVFPSLSLSSFTNHVGPPAETQPCSVCDGESDLFSEVVEDKSVLKVIQVWHCQLDNLQC